MSKGLSWRNRSKSEIRGEIDVVDRRVLVGGELKIQLDQ